MKRVLFFLLSFILLWSSVQAQTYTQAQVDNAIVSVMSRYDVDTQIQKLSEVLPKIWALQLANPPRQTWDILDMISKAAKKHINTLLAENVDIDMDPPSSKEQDMYRVMNNYRQTKWLSDLVINNTLAQAAQMLADDMAEQDFFGHVNPQWVWYVQRLDLLWYEFVYVSENLAQWNVDADEIVSLRSVSPVHEKNLYSTKAIDVWVWYDETQHYRVAMYGAQK